MATISLRGTGGTVRRGGQVAATLAGWTLESAGDGYVLRGATGDADAYWLSQSPLIVTIPTGKTQEWQWRTGTAVLTGHQVVITLDGPPEFR